jgi:hypothetical protein
MLEKPGQGKVIVFHLILQATTTWYALGFAGVNWTIVL